MKTAFSILLFGLVVLGLGAVALWLAIRPPPPMPRPAEGVVLSGVTVINPGMERRPRQRVRVEGAAIVSIGDDPAPDLAGPFAGAYVLPGLIDVHVHFPPPTGLGQTELFAFLFLYHGVTSVRDVGDIDGRSTEPARTGVADGRFPGPRVFACGPFVDGEGAEWSNSRVVLRPAQADAVVEEIARDFDCVKAYDRLAPEVAAAVHEAGRRRGIPVIGHVPQGSRFEEVHLDEVQHMMGMAFAEGEEGPFPKSLKAWRRRMDEARAEELLSAALRREIALTPTLVTLDRTSRMDDHLALSREPDARLLPRYYRDVVWAPDVGVMAADLTPEDYAGMREALAIQERLVKRLHDAGARLHIGTDTLIPFVVPGASLHRELALFVDAGLTSEQAWALATRSNGAALGVRDLGRLVPGAPADLLVFREDPTRDLAALSTLEAVVARGRLYTREALDAQLARYRSHAEGFFFDTLSVALARRMMARIFAEPEG